MEVQTGGWHGLVDREAEVAAIEAAVARAVAGEGGVLVVRGPAGIGKSALLRVGGRLAETHGLRGLWAQAVPFERAFPFGVVRQLFEPVLARGDLAGEDLFAGAAAGARAVLGDEPGPQVTPDPSFASLHALYWLTANLAARAPLLVCVDDVVWCDEASLRFLGFLVRRLEGMAVAVALAYRTGEPGSSDSVDALVLDPRAEVVQPAPLSAAALAGMLVGELGEEVDAKFGAACLDATGGNPLLVAELLRALRAERVRPRASEVGRVRGIGAVAVGPAVRQRLALLGERAQAVAQAVSIFGEGVRREDLTATAAPGASELGDALTALTSAGIVRGEERVSFVHPLVADAVRASLSPSEDAHLHERAVRVLRERGASPRELAPHVIAGAVGAHPDAVGVLRDAAGWALAVGAPEAAVRYLDRAVAELNRVDDLTPLLLDLAKAKVQAGDPGARQDLERAIELARDVRTRATARIELSVVLFAAGEDVRSIEILDDGLDEVAPEDPELADRMEAYLLAHIEVAYPSQVKFPRIVRERVTRARSARKSGASVVGRLVLCSLAYEEFMGGGAATEAVRLVEQALANDELLYAEGPTCPAMYRAVAVLLMSDELARAVATVNLALAEARRLGSPTAFVWASAWRSGANLRLGRLVDAEADAHAAIDSSAQYLSGYGLTQARIWLSGCLTAQGRLDEARTLLRHIAGPDSPTMLTYLLIEMRLRLHLACGEYEAAVREFDLYRSLDEPTVDLVEWRRPASGGVNHRVLGARALIGLGDLDGARALVDEELPLAQALGTHRAIGMALHAAGQLEHGESRIETLQRAIEELARSQSRLEYAEALYDYGATLRRANHRSQARTPLQAALAISRDARAAPLRDRVAQELKATGARVSRPGMTGVDALTASEHRIASMAAAGTSNRDIAQALFVTVKTVEMHLGHVYHKLNLTRRIQLATALGEPGTSAEIALDAQLARPARAGP